MSNWEKTSQLFLERFRGSLSGKTVHIVGGGTSTNFVFINSLDRKNNFVVAINSSVKKISSPDVFLFTDLGVFETDILQSALQNASMVIFATWSHTLYQMMRSRPNHYAVTRGVEVVLRELTFSHELNVNAPKLIRGVDATQVAVHLSTIGCAKEIVLHGIDLHWLIDGPKHSAQSSFLSSRAEAFYVAWNNCDFELDDQSGGRLVDLAMIDSFRHWHSIVLRNKKLRLRNASRTSLLNNLISNYDTATNLQPLDGFNSDIWTDYPSSYQQKAEVFTDPTYEAMFSQLTQIMVSHDHNNFRILFLGYQLEEIRNLVSRNGGAALGKSEGLYAQPGEGFLLTRGGLNGVCLFKVQLNLLAAADSPKSAFVCVKRYESQIDSRGLFELSLFLGVADNLELGLILDDSLCRVLSGWRDDMFRHSHGVVGLILANGFNLVQRSDNASTYYREGSS
jgi:hypothetical protein